MKIKKDPIQHVFYYTLKSKDGFEYPLWYGGFGSPWKICENIIDALKNVPETVTEAITLKALEKHTKTHWFTIPVKEAYAQNRMHSCPSCGFTWSREEHDYVLLERYSETLSERGLHLASPFNKYFDGYLGYDNTADRILKSNFCKNCGKVCGRCRATTRGRNVNKCAPCRGVKKVAN